MPLGVLQLAGGFDPQTVQGLGTGVRIGGSLLISIVVGAILLYGAPDFLERTIRRAREETVRSFLWGFGVEIAIFIVSVLLIITIIGALVAIPLLLVLAIIVYVGQISVFIHLGRRALEYADVDNDLVALVVAAVLAAVLGAIPILGPVLTFVAGAVGFGAILVNWRSD
ncbi:hypothetical protein [Halocalculus aciditolerans]|uniref:DUF8173 domain-containing protein n=1 Tax=Halocalculus aciditolerans TaxID=1383812 RepID=A0A830F5Q3_9EURY|nr:hypothetical protein [Halocalculus aciditolerans]GGL57123.1 hypothetical protein GCM10009039_14120 [Halocalculus aciditolerans]